MDQNTENFVLFDACDLNFEPMTLILKVDLDMVVTYLHAKNKANRSKGLKVLVLGNAHRQTNRWTDRQTDMCKTFTYQPMLVVMGACRRQFGFTDNLYFFNVKC